MAKSKDEQVKCSFWLARPIWRAAKIQAMDEKLELQELMALALTEYLNRRHIEGIALVKAAAKKAGLA